ncbi:MAG: prolyl aminopeptidase [Alphaproteobacteria bacterium]
MISKAPLHTAETVDRLPACLYPAIDSYATGRLVVDGRHSLYWEQSGNPRGIPVVFVHGGPGAGTSPIYRRFFDPRHYRIILFDQRGSGRSAPLAEIRDNTTAHLVADMELLRRRLDVERWVVFGGSWGSTLALAYGQAHPERCLGFILRGIFLFRDHEVEWFLHDMGRFFPEAERHFVGFLPPGERDDLLGSYYARLCHPDPGVHCPAARAWAAYEDACSRLLPRPGQGGTPGCESLALARIEAHYMVHRGFMAENALLEGLPVLHRHPAVIVQGRYDMVCPLATADELARAWPGADYTVVPDAGHSALEVGTASALVAATETFIEALADF